VCWILNGKTVPDTEPTNYGFIYIITYTNGKKYIGKKNFFSFKTLDALKNGNKRDNHYLFKKVREKGKLVKKETVKFESDWREYCGSSEEGSQYEVEKKEIVEICSDAINHTFAEAEWLVKEDVLRSDVYINKNILKKFFKGRITEPIWRKEDGES
jgi:hypothetical protein